MDYAHFLEDHLGVVDRVVRAIAACSYMSTADAADFRSQALMHLMADDYRVLRAFEGRSSLATYLGVVLRRLWQDQCARRWGRWRPSAEARRLGPVAIRLECLVQRDGRSLDEAITALQTSDSIAANELMAMWQRLPPRPKRRMVSDEALADMADASVAVSVSCEGQEVAAQVSRALRDAIDVLTAEDRRLLRLRFVHGTSMADISRALGMRQMQIYPRFVRLLRTLRTALEARGIRATDVEISSGVALLPSV